MFATLQANLSAALAALPTIGSTSNISIGGTATAVTVSFIGALAGANQTLMTVFNNSLTGGTTPSLSVATTTTGVFATTLNAGVLAVGDNAALGTGGLALNGGAVWAAGGNRNLANAVSLGGIVILGGRRDYGDTNTVTFTG